LEDRELMKVRREVGVLIDSKERERSSQLRQRKRRRR